MMKRSALHSSHLADHGVSPVATLVAQLASPLVAAFAGGFSAVWSHWNLPQLALCQV